MPSPTAWTIALNRKAGKHSTERSSILEALKGQADLLSARLGSRESVGQAINLPLAVYYDVHRAVLDVPLRVRETQLNSPRTAYGDALGHGGTDFRGFFIWFRNREDAENEGIRDNPGHHDRDLTAVRRAIEQFTQFTEFRPPRNLTKTSLFLDNSKQKAFHMGESPTLKLRSTRWRRMC